MSKNFLAAIHAQNKALEIGKSEANVRMEMSQTSHQYLVRNTVNFAVT